MFASLAAALRVGGLFIFIAVAAAAPEANLRDLLARPTDSKTSEDDEALDALIGLRREFRDRLEQSAGLR